VKLGRVGPDQVCFRYLTPKWSFVPLSGAGAAAEGGRFNRIGIDALYLSMSPQTALEEYRQNSSLVPPATLASYLVTIETVVDLSDGFDPAIWTPEWADWNCSWRKIARIDKKVPPTWHLADSVISVGHSGILFPSTRHPGGTNLVIFGSNLSPHDRLDVHDPDSRLPRDQSSWPS
jgi:RES domain-containing protein